MTASTLHAQAWLDAAAHQVADKERILRELEAEHAPPELIEHGKTLLVMCNALMHKATVQYLNAITH